MEIVHARARRRFTRGLKMKPLALMKKLRKAKKEAPVNEKPAVVKTHLRNMIVLPDMIGSIIDKTNNKTNKKVNNNKHSQRSGCLRSTEYGWQGQRRLRRRGKDDDDDDDNKNDIDNEGKRNKNNN